MSWRKRKFLPSEPQQPDYSQRNPDQTGSDLRLSVEAHEAVVLQGPHTQLAAQSLEIVRIEDSTQGSGWKIGDALIRLGGNSLRPKRKTVETSIFDAEDVEDDQPADDEETAVWVDRYVSSMAL